MIVDDWKTNLSLLDRSWSSWRGCQRKKRTHFDELGCQPLNPLKTLPGIRKFFKTTVSDSYEIQPDLSKLLGRHQSRKQLAIYIYIIYIIYLLNHLKRCIVARVV